MFPTEIPQIKRKTFLTLSGLSITDKHSNDCIIEAINTYTPIYEHDEMAENA
jgi:hypothetical protein